MRRASSFAWLSLSIVLAACAPVARDPSAPASSSASANDATSAGTTEFAAPAPSADAYGTRPSEGPAIGGARAEALAHAVIAATDARGQKLEGDGRLARLAAWVGANADGAGNPPPAPVVDFAARHLGLTEEAPTLFLMGQGREPVWADSLAQLLERGPQNFGYNRYGVAIVEHAGERLAVVALTAANAELEPIPRKMAVGGAIALRGRLRAGFEHPILAVTFPDGSVTKSPAGGAAFDAVVPVATRGIFRIELLAEGPHGIDVVANFPVFVAVDAPRAMSASLATSGTAADAPERLLAHLNASRASAGLAPLELFEPLASIAAAHSRDMVDHGFFGHVSPTTGDPAARVKAAGLAFPLVAENIGRAANADVVHQMLLDSPGHRANVMNPSLTHVGIGVVADRHGDATAIVATEVFARMAKPIDVAGAPARVLEAMNGARLTAAARSLDPDARLAAAAQRGAAAFFEGTLDDALAAATSALGPPGGARRGEAWKTVARVETYVVTVTTLDEVATLDFVREAGARLAGIGVAQGPRADTGPHTIVVVVMLGWPRSPR